MNRRRTGFSVFHSDRREKARRNEKQKARRCLICCVTAILLTALLSSSPSWGSPSEWALAFDGVDDVVELSRRYGPHPLPLFHDAMEARTAELFFKAYNGTVEQVFYDEGGGEDGLAIRMKDGKIEAAVRVHYEQTTLSGPFTGIQEWHHVALVFDAGHVLLYLDGDLVQDATVDSPVMPFRENGAGLGATVNQDAFDNGISGPLNETCFTHGVLDEVRVWSVARSREEIQQYAAHPLDGTEPGLEAYWRLEEGTGQILADSSGNARTVYRGHDAAEEPSDPSWSEDGAPVSSLNVIVSAHIEPAFPYTQDDLDCVTEIENLGGYPELFLSYRWFRDGEELLEGTEIGEEILSVTGAVLPYHFTAKNETFFCAARVTDGTNYVRATTDPVAILNSAPSAPEFLLLPEDPTPDDGLAVWILVESTDPDGDTVDYVFEWFESEDGEEWRRRTELSGSLDPYNEGEPEISRLYTQMAEFWKVVVTPVELEHATSGATELLPSHLIAAPQVAALGSSAAQDVFIIPDLTGDDRVDCEDLIVLRSVWHERKEEMDPNLGVLFFEASEPVHAQVGIRHLLKLAAMGWYLGKGK